VALYDVKDLGLARRYVTVSVNPAGRITELIEKPQNPKTTLIATCVYILPKTALPRISEYVGRGIGNDEPGRFMEWLCKHEAVYGYMLQGYWRDIGSIETYRETDSFVKRRIAYSTKSQGRLQPSMKCERKPFFECSGALV